MSRTKTPRPKKPHCGRCLHTGFTAGKADDGRPRFTCDRCGNTWSHGWTGGDYLAGAQNVAERPMPEWIRTP